MIRADLYQELAEWAAVAVVRAYEEYQGEFQHITRRARARFEARDWRGAQQDTIERLDIRPRLVRRVVQEIGERLGPAASEKELWARMKQVYTRRVAGRPDMELTETFFNSVTRRVFATVGVDPNIEFVASDFVLPPPGTTARVYKTYPRQPVTAALVSGILRDFAFDAPYHDLEGDARLAAEEIDGYLRGLEDAQPLHSVDMVRSVFFRGKGAYLVGRMRRGSISSPLIFALLHDEQGVHVDAVLLTPSDASVVFSFTRSYFRVEMERPADLAAFLKSILPQKRVSELYTAIGYNKHGKTELYREILQHLERSKDRFIPARGDRGLVMVVFTLPSLDVVFKVIRDRFPAPKTVTRQEVMQKYQLVFRHDRAGRLVDAQEFEHLAVERSRFAPELLEELQRECADTVRVTDGMVHIRHVYAERRVSPLNLYLRQTDEWTARQAVLDYGQAIRDLAATNTFPGDLLLKNFGVTRTGRVIFYDYDELCLVTDCVFRDIPPAQTDEEETSGEPWFYVGEDDVFPEEFLPFLGFPEPLRRAFLSAHAEILNANFWRKMQERHRAGEIVDIFPYKQGQRLSHRGR